MQIVEFLIATLLVFFATTSAFVELRLVNQGFLDMRRQLYNKEAKSQLDDALCSVSGPQTSQQHLMQIGAISFHCQATPHPIHPYDYWTCRNTTGESEQSHVSLCPRRIHERTK